MHKYVYWTVNQFTKLISPELKPRPSNIYLNSVTTDITCLTQELSSTVYFNTINDIELPTQI